jgi:hypothetical protein
MGIRPTSPAATANGPSAAHPQSDGYNVESGGIVRGTSHLSGCVGWGREAVGVSLSDCHGVTWGGVGFLVSFLVLALVGTKHGRERSSQ